MPGGRSSVGRASASQAEGRGFEPHRPLLRKPWKQGFSVSRAANTRSDVATEWQHSSRAAWLVESIASEQSGEAGLSRSEQVDRPRARPPRARGRRAFQGLAGGRRASRPGRASILPALIDTLRGDRCRPRPPRGGANAWRRSWNDCPASTPSPSRRRRHQPARARLRVPDESGSGAQRCDVASPRNSPADTNGVAKRGGRHVARRPTARAQSSSPRRPSRTALRLSRVGERCST